MTTSITREEKLRSAPPDFNRLARIYRWMEWLTFGPFLQRCRCSFLHRVGSRSHGLILGDGDGRFTARLVPMNPAISIDAVDASDAMLRQLLARADSLRVHAHKADVRTFRPPQSRYDLIATHFFLDCLDNREVRNTASLLRHHSGPETLWLISEFAIPSNLFGRLIARPLVSALYLAFSLLTNLHTHELPNHHQDLGVCGWELIEQHEYLGGLLIAELWHLDRRLVASVCPEQPASAQESR